jgi:hypothetical protein
VLKGLKDRFPRLARVWADGVYAGRLVEWAGEEGSVCARYRLQTKGTDWLFRFAMALDRRANLRMAEQLRSPRSGLRDQSTQERGLDENRHDPPYGAKARLSILRQVLSQLLDVGQKAELLFLTDSAILFCVPFAPAQGGTLGSIRILCRLD